MLLGFRIIMEISITQIGKFVLSKINYEEKVFVCEKDSVPAYFRR